MPEMIAPPSAPMLTDMPEPRIQGTVPDEPDDILDPPVPPSALAAAQGPLKRPRKAQEPLKDIPPPQVLADTHQAHEALLQGFLSALQGQLRELLLSEVKNFGDTADSTLLAIRKWIDTNGTPSEHATYQLAGVLDKLQTQGMTLKGDPYMASLQAVTPQGFPVTITLTKQSAGELTDALGGLVGWLQQAGFRAGA